LNRDGVTIAIPNWNHEVFLPRSISASLDAVRRLRARGLDGEVLVVDDASRDGSASLLRSLEAQYGRDGLRVIVQEENNGLAATRNLALLEARFRSIVFHDADNEIVGENLPLFLQAMDETGAAAVYGNLLVRTAGSSASFWVNSNESFQTRVFDENYIDAFAMFDRVQIMDLGGYSPSQQTWADWELWLHLAANGRRLVFVPLTFGVYHVLPNSMLQATTDHDSIKLKFKRMFDQVGFRKALPLRTKHDRYFPGVGAV
jgi:glycosyltransferase involved in cell wall biosynthesis